MPTELNCVLARITSEVIAMGRQTSGGKVTSKKLMKLIPESSREWGQQYFLSVFECGKSITRACPVELYLQEVPGF